MGEGSHLSSPSFSFGEGVDLPQSEERHKEYLKEWRTRPESKEIEKQARKRYRSNPDVLKREVERNRKWIKDNPEKARMSTRATKLKRLYGLLKGDYEVIFWSQGGGCKVCGSHESGRTDSKAFPVDHNHVTGEFRGILCHNCNKALGHAKDSPELLRQLADYLEENQ